MSYHGGEKADCWVIAVEPSVCQSFRGRIVKSLSPPLGLLVVFQHEEPLEAGEGRLLHTGGLGGQGGTAGLRGYRPGNNNVRIYTPTQIKGDLLKSVGPQCPSV